MFVNLSKIKHIKEGEKKDEGRDEMKVVNMRGRIKKYGGNSLSGG